MSKDEKLITLAKELKSLRRAIKIECYSKYNSTFAVFRYNAGSWLIELRKQYADTVDQIRELIQTM